MNLYVRYTKQAFKCKPEGWESTKQIKESIDYFLPVEKVKELFENGHSVLLANMKDNTSLSGDNVSHMNTLALDIDSKEYPILMPSMVTRVYKMIGVKPIIAYPTFSDKNLTRFRLIYMLESTIDGEVYRALYNALVWKLGEYIDKQAKNPNRIWHGTDKQVFLYDNYIPLSFELIVSLITAHKNHIYESEKKAKKKRETNFKKGKYNNVAPTNKYILPEYKNTVCELLMSFIPLKDFIVDKFGGSFNRRGDGWQGACPLHGGTSKTSFYITDEIYTCFSECGTGNLITLARRFYGIDNFTTIAFLLASEYDIIIPYEYLGGIY